MAIDVSNINLFSLPSLVIEERKNLPGIRAIYIVLSQTNEVLYIGKANGLRQRWITHHQ